MKATETTQLRGGDDREEIAQICKLWGVTEVACWNIADEVATLIAKARKEAKHQQRHQPLGVSRWIAVGKEHNYWLHPMTAKQFDTQKQALIEEFRGMLEKKKIPGKAGKSTYSGAEDLATQSWEIGRKHGFNQALTDVRDGLERMI